MFPQRKCSFFSFIRFVLNIYSRKTYERANTSACLSTQGENSLANTALNFAQAHYGDLALRRTKPLVASSLVSSVIMSDGKSCWAHFKRTSLYSSRGSSSYFFLFPRCSVIRQRRRQHTRASRERFHSSKSQSYAALAAHSARQTAPPELRDARYRVASHTPYDSTFPFIIFFLVSTKPVFR